MDPFDPYSPFKFKFFNSSLLTFYGAQGLTIIIIQVLYMQVLT